MKIYHIFINNLFAERHLDCLQILAWCNYILFKIFLNIIELSVKKIKTWNIFCFASINISYIHKDRYLPISVYVTAKNLLPSSNSDFSPADLALHIFTLLYSLWPPLLSPLLWDQYLASHTEVRPWGKYLLFCFT